MQASQVDETITNEDSIVVPFTSGRILASLSGGLDIGAVSLNNNMGSNKSIILPMCQEREIGTLTVPKQGEQPEFEVPQWFADLVEGYGPNTPKNVRGVMRNIMTNMERDEFELTIDREYQTNILVPADHENAFYKEAPNVALNHLRYEILAGKPDTDYADYRDVVSAKEFRQNGHILEATLRSTLMKAWAVDEIDLPYALCRDLRWLGAQYLTKNTRGNLFPQLKPTVEEYVRHIEAEQMKGRNEEWGALAAFSQVIGR